MPPSLHPPLSLADAAMSLMLIACVHWMWGQRTHTYTQGCGGCSVTCLQVGTSHHAQDCLGASHSFHEHLDQPASGTTNSRLSMMSPPSFFTLCHPCFGLVCLLSCSCVQSPKGKRSFRSGWRPPSNGAGLSMASDHRHKQDTHAELEDFLSSEAGFVDDVILEVGVAEMLC